MSLIDIQTRVTAAETAAGREPGVVQLIAVSKVQPLARVAAVLKQGQRLFGENKVQEALHKWPEFQTEFASVKVHLLGPLQTNKVKQAVQFFDGIHAVDRPKLARKLAEEVQNQGRAPDMFVQVNTGEESQKSGVIPGEADQFISSCLAMELPIKGLMVIPPVRESPVPHFAMLGEIARRNGLAELSMGMSADFEQAIALGATYVRVGSAIFGSRSYP